MKHIDKMIVIYLATLFPNFFALKIFEFPNTKVENSKVTIVNNSPTPEQFTLCLDFYNRLDSKRRLLASKGSKDLDIQISKDACRMNIRVAGIWYLALPYPCVDLVKWLTLCISYNSEDQSFTLAFQNEILLVKKDSFPNRQLSNNFLKRLTLGEKDPKFKFVGDVTCVNIWSKVFNNDTLKSLSNCGLSNNEEIPDLLNWDNVQVTKEGVIEERDVEEYPCTNADNNVHDVLIPITTASMYDAVTNCKTLGGKFYFPLKEEEVSGFVDFVKSNMEDAKCGDYIWSNYVMNSYDGNNWTLYENSTAWSTPPYKYPGWLDFAVGQPNGGENEVCAGISLDPEEPSLLHDLRCKDEGYCYVCRSYSKTLYLLMFCKLFLPRFDEVSYMWFRGSCDGLDAVMDNDFLLDADNAKRNVDKGVEFTGFTRSKLVLDQESERWSVVSIADGTKIISLDTKVKQ